MAKTDTSATGERGTGGARRPRLHPNWASVGIPRADEPAQMLGRPVVEYEDGGIPGYWSEAHDSLLVGLDAPDLNVDAELRFAERGHFQGQKLQRLASTPENTYLPFIKRFLCKQPELWPKEGELAPMFAATPAFEAAGPRAAQAVFDREWTRRADRWPWLGHTTERRDRSDAALVDRILNCMNPCLPRWAEGSDPTTAGDRELVVEFIWPAGDAMRSGDYQLPDTRAILGGAYDPDADYPFESLELRAIETCGQRFEPDGSDPDAPDHDWTQWGHIKRLFRTSWIVSGQTDQHITRGHLISELYALAAGETLPAEHPVRQLLWPHLRSVVAINNYGNPLIFEESGVVVQASALSLQAAEVRFSEQLASLDWAGFQPRRALVEGHRFARAANLYWTALLAHCERTLRDQMPASRAAEGWVQAREFVAAAAELSPTFRPLHNRDPADFPCDRELSTRPRRPGSRAMRRLAPQGVDDRDLAELARACAHAIYHATFFHGWCNDQQFDAGGELQYCTFGQRRRDDPTVPPKDIDDWEQNFAPSLEHATYQLFLAETLAKTEWGYLTATPHGPVVLDDEVTRTRGGKRIRVEPDCDVPESLQQELEGIREESAALGHGLSVDWIRARVNI